MSYAERIACPEDIRRVQNMKRMKQMRQDIKAAKMIVTENGGDASTFPVNPLRKTEPATIQVCNIQVPTFNSRSAKMQVPMELIEIPASFGCAAGDTACAHAVADCFEAEAKDKRKERQEKALTKMQKVQEEVKKRSEERKAMEKAYLAQMKGETEAKSGFAPEEDEKPTDEKPTEEKPKEEGGEVKHTMTEEQPVAEHVAPTEGTCEWRFHQMVIAFVTHHDEKMAQQQAHQAAVQQWFAQMAAAYPLLTIPAWLSEDNFGLTAGPMEVEGAFPGDQHGEFDEFNDFQFEEDDFWALEEALTEEEEQDSGL